MIDNPYPEDWKELQTGVSRLFNEIGLTSETEKVISTPRGSVCERQCKNDPLTAI
jgi:hypothetical protein